MQKRLLVPSRVRRVPRQFSWVDQRLVRDHHIERCDSTALALYLFLVTVADAQGLSYYADASIERLLSLRPDALAAAREALIRAGLLAYEAPLYQVLALDHRPEPPAPAQAHSRRGAGALKAVREHGSFMPRIGTHDLTFEHSSPQRFYVAADLEKPLTAQQAAIQSRLQDLYLLGGFLSLVVAVLLLRQDRFARGSASTTDRAPSAVEETELDAVRPGDVAQIP